MENGNKPLMAEERIKERINQIALEKSASPSDWAWIEKYMIEGYEIAKEEFANQPKPVVSEWISVKDRLPENSNWYLVIERNQVNFLFYDSIGIWLCRTDANDDEAEWNHEVTHWMPLPEPPKE